MDLDKARKIPEHLDDVVDNALFKIVYVIHPAFKTMGFTANGITILSAIVQTTGVYAIYHSHFALGGILYFVGYFFDVMDGWYARKYKMVSSYGDKLDHYSDIIVHVLLYACVTFHPVFTLQVKAMWYAMALTFLFLSSLHLACKDELYYKGKLTGTTLDILRPLCKYVNNDMMQYLRWVGTGTLNLMVMMFFVCAPFFTTKPPLSLSE